MKSARYLSIAFVEVVLLIPLTISIMGCGKVWVAIHSYDGGSRGGSSHLSRQWTVEDGTSGGTVYGGPIAVDSSGNAYMTGEISGAGLDGKARIGSTDLIITKYNSSGARQWTVEDGTAGGAAYGEGVAVDSVGNVYVTGETESAGLDGNMLIGTADFILTKYNSSGTRQWTVEDGTAGGFSEGVGIAIDSSDNIYVAGFTQSAGLDGNALVGTDDLIVTKYNSSGTRLWTVEDGTSGGSVYGFAVSLDSLGNIYVTGDTSGAGLDGNSLKGNLDLIITKYNSSGSRLWTVEDGTTGGNVWGNGIVADSSGNIYATGEVAGAGLDGNALIGTKDLILTKYDSSGTRLWTLEDGAVGASVYGSGCAVDSTGSIYVSGNTSGAGLDGNTLIGSTDLILTKYNSSGTRQLTVEDGTSGGSAFGDGISFDPFGNLYLAGGTSGAGIDGYALKGTDDIFISKY